MRKILTHGDTRNVMRGIPKCITQEELKRNKSNIDTRGTEKEAVWKGIINVPTLLKVVCMIPRLYTTSVCFHKT